LFVSTLCGKSKSLIMTFCWWTKAPLYNTILSQVWNKITNLILVLYSF
jgi:hypothetical protein